MSVQLKPFKIALIQDSFFFNSFLLAELYIAEKKFINLFRKLIFPIFAQYTIKMTLKYFIVNMPCDVLPVVLFLPAFSSALACAGLCCTHIVRLVFPGPASYALVSVLLSLLVSFLSRSFRLPRFCLPLRQGPVNVLPQSGL